MALLCCGAGVAAARRLTELDPLPCSHVNVFAARPHLLFCYFRLPSWIALAKLQSHYKTLLKKAAIGKSVAVVLAVLKRGVFKAQSAGSHEKVPF